MNLPLSAEDLLEENAALRLRLQEAEDTLTAIRSSDVDALIVGEHIFTLDSANATENTLRRDVLTQMEDAVLAFDTDAHVIYMNPAAERQYDRSMSEILGRPSTALYSERWSDPAERAAAQRQLEVQGSCRMRSIHVRADGRSMHVESTLSRLYDGGSAVIGELAVIRNIDERVRAEEVMLEADRRKDEFLATLAHELRNPLAPIRNAVELMRLAPDAAAQERARGIINRQLQQMVHLVDDLLDVSRISQGKVELRREDADVGHIVQAAIETSRPVIDAGRHRLSVRLPAPGTLMVHADVTRASQVVANLLNNAAKYTPQLGNIQVRAEGEGGQAVITVVDSGVGISPAMLPRVFDMFTQVDRSEAHAQGGLGIGLALVKRLVEMHGGSVEAHSEGRGRGCTFIVRLPLAQALHAEGTAHPVNTISVASHAGAKVLVIDDNVDSAESLSLVLDMLGYQTRTAHDGAAALEAAEAYRPRIAVVDIGLPKLSGHEVARRIRREPWGRSVLLLALSGWGQDEDRRKSAEAGFDHHFVKPVDLNALTEVLAQARADAAD